MARYRLAEPTTRFARPPDQKHGSASSIVLLVFQRVGRPPIARRFVCANGENQLSAANCSLSRASLVQLCGPGEKQRTNTMPFSRDSQTTAPSVGLSRTTGPSQIKWIERRSVGSTKLR